MTSPCIFGASMVERGAGRSPRCSRSRTSRSRREAALERGLRVARPVATDQVVGRPCGGVTGIAETPAAFRAPPAARTVKDRHILIDHPGKLARAVPQAPAVGPDRRGPLTEGHIRGARLAIALADEIHDVFEESRGVAPNHRFLLGIDVFRRAQPAIGRHRRPTVRVRSVEDYGSAARRASCTSSRRRRQSVRHPRQRNGGRS